MRFELYDWQKEIVLHEGDVTIRGGRQDGKSEAVAERIVYLAKKYPGSRHLIIAATGRQSGFLYEKVVERLGSHKSNYRKRRTLSLIPLKNGTDIYRFEVGRTGVYVEGLSSIDFIYIDEAIHMGNKVYDSIIPMMAEPKSRGLGWITLLSSTRGAPEGYFYDSFKIKSFLKIHIKSEDVPHMDKEFLRQEKERLGERMYNVIYDGEFDEIGDKYFSPEIIDRQIKIAFWSHKKNYNMLNQYYMGIDPARFGRNNAAFAICEIPGKDIYNLVHGEEHEKTSLIDLRNIAEKLHNIFLTKLLFIDDGGFGAGLIDIMEERFKRKLRAINNKAKGKEFKILKEDLYSNTLHMLETGKLNLVNNKIIIDGLKNVKINAEDPDNIKIIGTDMSEAIVRACWCSKEKYIMPRLLRF